MDLSAIIKAVTAPRSEGEAKQALDLTPGDKLVGRVLQLEADGRALIDLGGPRVLARVGFAVNPGQALRLTVVQSGQVLHLRSEPPETSPKLPLDALNSPGAALTPGERQEMAQIIQGVINRLAARGGSSGVHTPLINAMRQILTLFEPLPMEKSTAEIAQWLRHTLENHGSLFEKRLADTEIRAPLPPQDQSSAAGLQADAPVRAIITRDAKFQLMILKHALARTDVPPPMAGFIGDKEAARLRTGVEKMLNHLEQQQERAITRSGQGEPMQLLQHLLPFADGHPPVRLKVYYPRKDRAGETDAAHRIALLLDMDRLGLIRGDIAKVKDVLQVHFFVPDEAVRKHFLGQHAVILKALKGSFDHVRVEVSVSREKIARFHEEDMQGDAPGRINIKA